MHSVPAGSTGGGDGSLANFEKGTQESAPFGGRLPFPMPLLFWRRGLDDY